MTFFLRSLRPVCHSLHRSYLLPTTTIGLKHSFWRVTSAHIRSNNVPASLTGRCMLQKRPLHSITEKVLYLLTGLKPLNPEARKQAICNHQKLWVAHFSIHNHEEADRHWEMSYSIQLTDIPKDFSTQKYYLGLIEKKNEELTRTERQELVDLYHFAVKETESPIWRWQLKQKLAEYHSLLLTS